MKILLANNVDPDQMPDLGLHCLPRPFYGFPGKNGLKYTQDDVQNVQFLLFWAIK